MGVFGKVPRSYQQAEKSIDSDLWLAAADILRENYTAPLLNLHLDAISYLWSPNYPKKLMLWLFPLLKTLSNWKLVTQ